MTSDKTMRDTRADETITFEEAVRRLPVGRLRALMPDLVGDLLYVDRSGTVNDDLTMGMYGYEFEDYVSGRALSVLSSQLYEPDAPTVDLERILWAVRDDVYEDAYDALMIWPETEVGPVTTGAAEVLSRELSSAAARVEVCAPTWPDFVMTMVEQGTYRFDLSLVDDIVTGHEFRCELMVGHDGVFSGDPLTNGLVEDLLSGEADPEDFDEQELADTPVLAYARSQGLTLEDLREGAERYASRDSHGLIDGRREPLTPAETIVEEVSSASTDNVCQVGVLCRLTIPQICALVDKGSGARAEFDLSRTPIIGLYDRFSGAGGVFGLEPSGERLEISSLGTGPDLFVSQVMLPDARESPWYTIDECYGLLPKASDAVARVEAPSGVDEPDEGNPPLSRARDLPTHAPREAAPPERGRDR